MKITKKELVKLIENQIRKQLNESTEMNIIDLSKYVQHKLKKQTKITNQFEAYQYILSEYKKLCNQLDFDYEFNYIDDIRNNVGSIDELKSFFEKYIK